MKSILLIAIVISLIKVNAQTYDDSIFAYCQQYKKDLYEDEHAPLKKRDIKYVNFFQPDEAYRITAAIQLIVDAKQFDMPTSSGKIKQYIKYADAVFFVNDLQQHLAIYQSIALREKDEYKNYLFIPFNDATNGEVTYGGGRYIDITIQDKKENYVVIDFNKAYNPYSAFADGYNCPVPPAENKLTVAIMAGEKKFKKKH